MIKAIINYNDVDDEFRRMNDILGVLKYKYKNIDVSYNKVIPKAGKGEKKNELFVIINNEKLDCNHNLEFYMKAVENILNKGKKMLNKKIIILREKVKSILRNMLPFNELDFKIHFDKDYKQLRYIDFYMHHEYIRIKKGTKVENISDMNNKIRKCLKDIYKEFQEEIQSLFDRNYYDFKE